MPLISLFDGAHQAIAPKLETLDALDGESDAQKICALKALLAASIKKPLRMDGESKTQVVCCAD